MNKLLTSASPEHFRSPQTERVNIFPKSTAMLRSIFCVCLAMLVVGCASLPSIDNLQSQRKQVRIASEKGALSLSRSQDIISRLGPSKGAAGFLERHLEVEEAVSRAPLIAGNEVTLLADGPSTYRAMLAGIQSARHYIHMESYIFDDDDIGGLFADALIEKSQKGVSVALMVDAIGTLSTSDALFARMRAAGVQVQIFNPLNPLANPFGWSPNERSHRKLLVVDGKIGFLGGINVSGVYRSSSFGSGRSKSDDDDKAADDVAWRDTHVQIVGPAVVEIERVFQEGWRSQNGPAIEERGLLNPAGRKGDDVVRILSNEPGANDNYEVYLTLISAFKSAEKSIYITMAYFVPDQAFITVLIEAAQRGVDVVLILPGFSDSSIVLQAGRSHYGDLLKGGVKIFERSDALLHAKTAVVDGVWATVGSSNMDWRSFTLNHEINAVILGPRFAQQMENLFFIDRAAAAPISLAEWKDRGIKNRFMEFIGRVIERAL